MAKKIFLFVFLFYHISVFASSISKDTARKTAENWIYNNNASKSKAIDEKTLTERNIGDEVDKIYLIASGNNKFVIIGGSEEVPVILGYGSNCNGELPTNLQSFLINLNKRKLFDDQIATQLNGANVYKHDPSKIVAPFVKTIRNQESPFNLSCPLYKDDKGNVSSEHCLVGCLATALEQVVSYYNYPSTLQDTLKGWKTDHYDVDTISPGTPIFHNKILDEYIKGEYSLEESKAVADLSYYCGIAAHMDWGLSSSGANVQSTIEPMRKAFNYKYVKHVCASDYSIENWHNLLYNELANQRPILFAGYTAVMGGHAFIIDGINSDGFYHVLWGYDNNYNGYFDLNILNTCEDPQDVTSNGELFGYYTNQEALLLHPESINEPLIDTLIHDNRIVIDSIRFLRQPDMNRYVTANVYVRNTGDVAISSSILLTTYDPDDSTRTQTADNIAIAGKVLEPYSSNCLTTYCWFHKYGTKVLTAFTDDSSYVYFDTIQVIPTEVPMLDIKIINTQSTDNKIKATINYTNTSKQYWAGNLITYCLYEGEETNENWGIQHFSVLNLAPEKNMTDSVEFNNLKPATKYTLVVKNNWVKKLSIPIETNQASGILPIELENNQDFQRVYNLQGVAINRIDDKGIYIIENKNGRHKIIKP